MERKDALSQEKARELSIKLAAPHAHLFDVAADELTGPLAVELLEKIYTLALKPQDTIGSEKIDRWHDFGLWAQKTLRRGRRGLKKLCPQELSLKMDVYEEILADLSQMRAAGIESEALNELALLGHQVFNGPSAKRVKIKFSFLSQFPLFVRRYAGHMAVACLLFFGSGIVAFGAVLIEPQLAYDTVPEAFLDFQPAEADNMHDIPKLMRPVAASEIITNNIQVTFMAFALGLVAGVGTAYLLISNGISIGAAGAWLYLQGHSLAYWGFIMPHGPTELLAICLSGGAGFMLADAILRPGPGGIKEALYGVALKAVTIEIGCMLMLLFAGAIEGFVSPSSIGIAARASVAVGTSLMWILYFLFSKPNK